MEVFYNNKKINNDDFLKVSETQVEPRVKLNVDISKTYLLIMYDPDAVVGNHVHWIIYNITNNNINTGNNMIPYKGPAPPPKTGKHRYIFELYQQISEPSSLKGKERNISLSNLKNNLKIDNPLYKIQFISENESGGKKTKKNKTNKKRTRVKKSRRIYY